MGSGISSGALVRPMIHVQDQRPDGAAGDFLTAGAWRVRALNTVVVNEIVGASLAANQITLPAGDYEVTALQTAYNNGNCQSRLYDATAGVMLLPGFTQLVGSTSGSTGLFPVVGRFSLAAPSAVELQIWPGVNNAAPTASAATGLVEVYSDVRIWKVG